MLVYGGARYGGVLDPLPNILPNPSVSPKS